MRVARAHQAATTIAVATLAAMALPAAALQIELKDVAADRLERQRAFNAGALPLPGTPNVALLQERLDEKGVTLAAPILVRIFKAESELEIWKEKAGSYVLFASYPICHWSGSLGPKLRTGDKQAPEGFYTVNRAQTRHVGRWPRSVDVGFPNFYDQSLARTGSDILIHGGCSSVGCFAMTNTVMDEIHQIASTAVEAGQTEIPVHVFPFRMTPPNMAANGLSPWAMFWENLKEGYDSFERTKRPPHVSVCNGRYLFKDTAAGERAGATEVCEPTLMAIRDQDEWLKDVPPPTARSIPRISIAVDAVITRSTTPQRSASNAAASTLNSVEPAPTAPQAVPGAVPGASLRADPADLPRFSWPLVR